MKSRIAGATHYATKVVSCMAGGGAVAAPKGASKASRPLQMEKMPDGSSQYVKGDDRSAKNDTTNKVIDKTNADFYGALGSIDGGAPDGKAQADKAIKADTAARKANSQNFNAWK